MKKEPKEYLLIKHAIVKNKKAWNNKEADKFLDEFINLVEKYDAYTIGNAQLLTENEYLKLLSKNEA